MTNNDLNSEVPKTVLQNQSCPTGQRVVFEADGVLHEYFHDDWQARAERFSKALDMEMGWIEQFVAHAPTVGSHYETILRDLLSEYLPGSVRVGNGFIFDAMRRRCSPQLDILVYSDIDESPIYRRGEFLIVQPSAVVGISEVKKRLTSINLGDWIRKTVSENLGWHMSYPYGVQKSSIFGFSSDVSTSTLAKNVAKAMTEFATTFSNKTRDKSDVKFACFNLALPSVYLRDRNEYISVSLDRLSSSKHLSQLSVTVFRSSGACGISPFLAGFETQDCRVGNRNLIASETLNEVVSTETISIPLLLMRRLSTAELLEHFCDAKDILRGTLFQTTRPLGCMAPSWAVPEKFDTLNEFMKLPGFSWQMFEAQNAE